MKRKVFNFLFIILLSILTFTSCNSFFNFDDNFYEVSFILSASDSFINEDFTLQTITVEKNYKLKESDFPLDYFYSNSSQYILLGWDTEVGTEITKDTKIYCKVEKLLQIPDSINIFENSNLINIKHVVFQKEKYNGNYTSTWDYSWEKGFDNYSITMYFIKDSVNGNTVIVSGNGALITRTDFSYFFRFINNTVVSIDFSGFRTFNTKNMNSMFYGCSSLTSLDLSSFDTSSVNYMTSMFKGCSSLTSLDLSSFDTSSVNYMTSMFEGCSSLTSIDLSSFDTSNVTDMSYMFEGCSKLTSLDLSSFNTSITQIFKSMFQDCSELETIYASDKFETYKCIGNDWKDMFSNCKKLIGTSNTGATTPYTSNYNINFAHIPQGNYDYGFFTAKSEN